MKNLHISDVSEDTSSSFTGEGKIHTCVHEGFKYTHVCIFIFAVGGSFNSDVDPFADQDFGEDTEEIMESSQVSELSRYKLGLQHAYVYT